MGVGNGSLDGVQGTPRTLEGIKDWEGKQKWELREAGVQNEECSWGVDSKGLRGHSRGGEVCHTNLPGWMIHQGLNEGSSGGYGFGKGVFLCVFPPPIQGAPP